MRIELPDLPYPLDALEPFISARTLSIHHGKHHRAYVDRTNALIGENPASLEEIIARAAGNPAKKVLFNNAAQAWNHAFYWRSLRPRGGPAPREFSNWAEALKTAANGHFGSGWVWLVRDGADLKVVSTSNADTPLVHGQVPLLVIDMWEHAYYLDHQERRAAYVAGVVDNLLNWELVECLTT
ncbi:MAG TPA: superoxide dismutase [Burkholderiales bacterium]|nr:superoxide dismutase [Burkholderiales bacterium]